MSEPLTYQQLKEMSVRVGVRKCEWCGEFLDADDQPIPRPDYIGNGLVSSTVCIRCIQRLKEQYQNTTQEDLNER